MPSRVWRWKYVSTIAVGLLAAAVATGALVRTFGGRDPGAVSKGNEAYAQKDYAHAAELARGRLKTAPDDVDALRLLARSSARLGRDAAANGMFSKLGSASLEAEDLFLLGVGLDHAGQKDSAEVVWKKAILLRPDHAESLERLIRTDLAQSRISEAARRAEELAKLPGWELWGELELATLRAELSDPSGSIEMLRRGLRRPEASALGARAIGQYRKLLARNLLKTGRAVEARTELRAALGDGPDHEASWLLSRAELREGAIDGARAALHDSSSYRAEHPMELEPSPYVGAERCASCHREETHALHGSRHATTLVQGAALEKLPYPERPVTDPDNPAVTHSFLRDAGSIRVQTRVKDEVLEAVVAYAFGAPDRYLSLVGNDRNGQPYILRLSRYESGGQSGWVRTTGHTAGADDAANYLGKPIDRVGGVHACLFCHTTDPKAVLDGVGPVKEDRAIGCERCHGPGGNHLEAIRAKLDDLAIVNPAKGPTESRIRVCGQCHSQHQPSSLPRTDPFWLRFQGTTLTWSRCYTESAGALDCSSCHDPHGVTERTPVNRDGRCLECHSGGPSSKSPNAALATKPASDAALRASICKVNASSGCVGCHMPSTEIKPLRATFTDHYIRIHREGGAGRAK